jgi:type IV secretory pathway TraG/TraD family ATPase VirD4
MEKANLSWIEKLKFQLNPKAKHDDEENSLFQDHSMTWVYGNERSGKTFKVVVPAIQKYKSLAVVIDTGDIKSYTNNFEGKRLFDFSPDEADSTIRLQPGEATTAFQPKFNPLHIIREGSKNKDALLLAELHLSSSKGFSQLNARDKQTSLQILSSLLCRTCSENMAQIQNTIESNDLKTLISITNIEIDLDGLDQESIYKALIEATKVYKDCIVSKNTSTTDFSIDNFQKDGIIYLNINNKLHANRSSNPIKLALALYLLRTLKIETLFVIEKADRLGVIDFLTKDHAAQRKKILITTRRPPPRPINFIDMNKPKY